MIEPQLSRVHHHHTSQVQDLLKVEVVLEALVQWHHLVCMHHRPTPILRYNLEDSLSRDMVNKLALYQATPKVHQIIDQQDLLTFRNNLPQVIRKDSNNLDRIVVLLQRSLIVVDRHLELHPMIREVEVQEARLQLVVV